MLERISGPGALLAIAFAAMIFFACGESSGNRSDGMPGIPEDLRTELLESCDFVDIIFYHSPASMNQSDPRSIQRAMGFIATETAEIDEMCSPLGRISYMTNGEITAEGDIYLSEKCQYIIFMVDNEPTYANAMSPEGIQFFQTILQSIQDQLPPQ